MLEEKKKLVQEKKYIVYCGVQLWAVCKKT